MMEEHRSGDGVDIEWLSIATYFFFHCRKLKQNHLAARRDWSKKQVLHTRLLQQIGSAHSGGETTIVHSHFRRLYDWFVYANPLHWILCVKSSRPWCLEWNPDGHESHVLSPRRCCTPLRKCVDVLDVREFQNSFCWRSVNLLLQVGRHYSAEKLWKCTRKSEQRSHIQVSITNTNSNLISRIKITFYANGHNPLWVQLFTRHGHSATEQT